MDPTFAAFWDRWLGVLGEDRFTTFMCNSVAMRLMDPTLLPSCVAFALVFSFDLQIPTGSR